MKLSPKACPLHCEFQGNIVCMETQVKCKINGISEMKSFFIQKHVFDLTYSYIYLIFNDLNLIYTSFLFC